jgi:hypothetical protein
MKKTLAKKEKQSEQAKTLKSEQTQPEAPVQKQETRQTVQNKLNLKTWVDVLVNPVETITQEKQNQNWRNALINYVLSGLIGGLIIGIAFILILLFYPSSLGSEASLIPSNPLMIIVSSLILIPIAWAVLILISSFINTFIFWVFSKLFSGTGTYSLQYYLTSIYSAPINIIASALMLIPIAIISTIMLIILALYSVYLLFIVLKATHEYSNSNAVLTIATPLILIILIIYSISIL